MTNNDNSKTITRPVDSTNDNSKKAANGTGNDRRLCNDISAAAANVYQNMLLAEEQADATKKKKKGAPTNNVHVNGTSHLWEPRTVAEVEAAKKKKKKEMAEAESIVIHDTRNNKINNKNNNNNMDVEVINIDDNEDGDDDDDNQQGRNNNNSVPTKVAFNVGPLPDAYKERMVLPLEHTRNLMLTMKNFAVMLADVVSNRGM